jgi:hypothetical protein
VRPHLCVHALIPRRQRAAGAVVGGAEKARRRYQNRIGRGRRRSLHHLVAARLERAHEIERKPVASENSIHLTRSHRRIRTRSSDDCDRPLTCPHAVRLLQASIAAGSRNPDTATSAQTMASTTAKVVPLFCMMRSRSPGFPLAEYSTSSDCISRWVPFVPPGAAEGPEDGAAGGCRFRKPYPIDSRSAANQNMIAA